MTDTDPGATSVPTEDEEGLRVGPGLPVGTILPFAGRWSDELSGQGWYQCKGQPLATTGEFAELFAAIGYAFGRPASDQFSLPDLRGWFIRGTAFDAATRTQREPDWASRLPPCSIFDAVGVGDTPHGVGTRQSYGTAPPHNPFAATHDHLSISKATADQGCAERPGKYTDAAQTFFATGGDLESRPVNKYVTYLIKARSDQGMPSSVVPVASLVPFAGQMGPAAPAEPVWQICHGEEIAILDAPDLFTAISFIHGGSGARFTLPDYRGWFLRGVTEDCPVDPDALKRTWAHPSGAVGSQGNQGNNIGASQFAATGAPTSTPFSTSVANLPTEDSDKRVAGSLRDLLGLSAGFLLVSLSDAGGDNETRPANVSVDWYIRSMTGPDPEMPYPVGAVAMTACTLAHNEWWLPCDGRTLPVAGFQALKAALGATYGGDATNVVLPDYRCRFLRGASYASHVDPDVAPPPGGTDDVDHRAGDPSIPTGGVGTFQEWATGRPTTPFQGRIPHYGQSDLGAHGNTNDGNACDDGPLTFETCTSGGDSETRPCNVYLNHYIRVK